MMLKMATEIDIIEFYACLTNLFAALTFSIILIKTFIHRNHVASYRYLQQFVASMTIWLLFTGLTFLPVSESIKLIFFHLSFIGITFSGFSFFFFCISYSLPKKEKLIRRLQILYIIPFISVIFIFITPIFPFFFEVKNINSVFDLTIEFYPWFFVHSTMNYGLSLIGMFFLFINIFLVKPENRKSRIFLALSSFVYIIFRISDSFISHHLITWITDPIICAILISIFYNIIYFDNNEQIIIHSLRNIYNLFPFPIIIADSHENFIHCNEAALRVFFDSDRSNINNFNLEKFLKLFTVLKPSEEQSKSIRLILKSNHDHSIFYLEENTISSLRKSIKGRIFVLTPDTIYKSLYNNLQKQAYTDPVTECQTRAFFEISKKGYIKKELLPLSVIMGDVDHLKTINDYFGHEMGDHYLNLCVQKMKSTMKENDGIFRMGGDEFMMILPMTDRETALSKVTAIKEDLQKETIGDGSLVPSISLGVATAQTFPFDFQRLMKLADNEMYSQKRSAPPPPHSTLTKKTPKIW